MLAAQVHKHEPVNSMTIKQLFQHGFVHLENDPRNSSMVYVRMPKPLLRIFCSIKRDMRGPFLDMLAASPKSGTYRSVKPQEIFTTCREYHGDIAETVQLLSLLARRRAVCC